MNDFQMFLPFHRWLFQFLDGVLQSTKVLNVDEVQFVSFFLLVHMTLVLYLRNYCLIQGHEGLLLRFLLGGLWF